MGLICIISKFYCILLMAKANSFKSEPWTALEKGEWSIFEDDFVHEKLFTLKATRKSPTSTIALKETLTQKDNKISTADELKVWFPFRENRTLYARVKNDGFKLHYDHGFLSQNDLRFNFYGSVQGKRTIGNLIYKIGVETQNKDLVFNWRLRYNQGENGLAIYKKTSYTQQKWNVGLVNVFDVFGKAWINSAIQLGWKSDNPKNLYYLRLNAGKKYERVNPANFLNAVTFDFIHKLTDNSKLAVQVKAILFSWKAISQIMKSPILLLPGNTSALTNQIPPSR